MYKKAGFGGGCHWCTEAVFQSLKGVLQVEQGLIASLQPDDAFSEAVIVTFDPAIIALQDLIAVHLSTHSSTSRHSLRHKYRSAVYYFEADDERKIKEIISLLQVDFQQRIITQALPFAHFKSSLPQHLQYYQSNPQKPFCTLYIHPKLQLIRKQFSQLTKRNTDSL